MTEKRRTFEVRPLTLREVREAALLHARELPHEFLSRLGPGFLARYYRAFVESPHATALAAADRRTERVEGVLIATFDTRAHYDGLVRRHGWALAGHLALRAVRRPALARELLRSRSTRYVRGVVRSALYGRKVIEAKGERVGFAAYVAVAADRRGRGIGGALFGAYEAQARGAGLDRIELATRPGSSGAGPFFARLGYRHAGERTSRSGERYDLYAKTLSAAPPGPYLSP